MANGWGQSHAGLRCNDMITDNIFDGRSALVHELVLGNCRSLAKILSNAFCNHYRERGDNQGYHALFRLMEGGHYG
jgi:hypothetical protein